MIAPYKTFQIQIKISTIAYISKLHLLINMRQCI